MQACLNFDKSPSNPYIMPAHLAGTTHQTLLLKLKIGSDNQTKNGTMNNENGDLGPPIYPGD